MGFLFFGNRVVSCLAVDPLAAQNPEVTGSRDLGLFPEGRDRISGVVLAVSGYREALDHHVDLAHLEARNFTAEIEFEY